MLQAIRVGAAIGEFGHIFMHLAAQHVAIRIRHSNTFDYGQETLNSIVAAPLHACESQA
jgi:hypothetical protein